MSGVHNLLSRNNGVRAELRREVNSTDCDRDARLAEDLNFEGLSPLRRKV